MELSLGTFQQESPRIVGIQQRNVGSSGEGAGFLPLRVILWLAQVRVLGLDFVSPFPAVSRDPQGRQGATQNLCLEL